MKTKTAEQDAARNHAEGPAAQKKPPVKTMNVAVILGDPTKPDDIEGYEEEDVKATVQMKKALAELDGYCFSYYDFHNTLLRDITRQKGKVDYVFNLCDVGFYNNDRRELHLPALLELLNIPYTGAGPACLAFCFDKQLVCALARELGIPVPASCYLRPGETPGRLPFGFPVIAKPNCGDGSVAITRKNVANSPAELENALGLIRAKLGKDQPIIIEEFLTGAELTVGMVGNVPGDMRILPITEEDFSPLPEGLPKICGYEAKWEPGSPYWNLKSKPAALSKKAERALSECSAKLFERLGCRDYARIDWRMDAAGKPHLLEVNPNPGWSWDGHMAKMSQVAGVGYVGFLKSILAAAEQRLGMGTAMPSKTI